MPASSVSDPADLAGWGRFPRARCRVIAPDRAAAVADAIREEACLIARGNGRAYGDAALNPDATLAMRGVAEILAFDGNSGRVTVGAGLLLADLLDVCLPLGWFPPVTPGTRFVTLGGMVAADVHGKNHHGAGSFGAHVERLTLALANGSTRVCGPDRDADLFAATLGGMGLTGVILDVTVRLRRVETALIRRRVLRARDLAEAMALFEAAVDWTYSVAWIDCLAGGSALGRSVLELGEHATAPEAAGAGCADPLRPVRRHPLRVPFDLPNACLNPWSVRIFNALYYARARPGESLVDAGRFFHPLDRVLDWNRIYGRSGLFQYQCVLPLAASQAGLTALLRVVARAGSGSFLSVLKRFGPSRGLAPGLLSFPMEGYTLALDFRTTPDNLRLAAHLDAIVADHGGRLYLAKDARMPADMLELYPGLERFRAVRAAVDPAGRFQSLLSRRLGL
jgi:FAD/FMN-containing dehydrogenase